MHDVGPAKLPGHCSKRLIQLVKAVWVVRVILELILRTAALIALASSALVLATTTPLVGVFPATGTFLTASSLVRILLVAATAILLILTLVLRLLVVLVRCGSTLRPGIALFLCERLVGLGLALWLVLILLLGFVSLIFRWHLLVLGLLLWLL